MKSWVMGMRCNEGTRLRSFQASGVIGDVRSGVPGLLHVHVMWVFIYARCIYYLRTYFGGNLDILLLFLHSLEILEPKIHKIISLQRQLQTPYSHAGF